MLTKKQFVDAMCFFKDYEQIQTTLTQALEPFFDGNGFLYKGNDKLYYEYLNLLKLSMNIDLTDEYDPISMWLYDASTSIYGEPDENGICKKIGEADQVFIDVKVADKVFHITNESELYDYIMYVYEQD